MLILIFGHGGVNISKRNIVISSSIYWREVQFSPTHSPCVFYPASPTLLPRHYHFGITSYFVFEELCNFKWYKNLLQQAPCVPRNCVRCWFICPFLCSSLMSLSTPFPSQDRYWIPLLLPRVKSNFQLGFGPPTFGNIFSSVLEAQ